MENREKPFFTRILTRTGEIDRPADIPQNPNRYVVVALGQTELSPDDQIVRREENLFATKYDGAQFGTPGMANMARTDTAVLEGWVGNPRGTKILEIGPGTGRITIPLADAVGKTGKVYAIETAARYLDELKTKAGKAGLNPNRLKLGVGDIQTVSPVELKTFTDGKVQTVAIWFGPLALMPTNPEGVLANCATILKPGGQFVTSTNSLDGISYRIPEQAIANGADPKLPLGYQPSIATKRSFSSSDATVPNGMVLADGSKLPAVFYDPKDLAKKITTAGLQVQEVVGITRLTGLYPANPKDAEAVAKYVGIVQTVDPAAGALMQRNIANAAEVWDIAKGTDDDRARDPNVLTEYNYPAIRAVKP